MTNKNVKVLLAGYNSEIGQVFRRLANADPNLEIVACFEKENCNIGLPFACDLASLIDIGSFSRYKVDVVIDCASHEATDVLLQYVSQIRPLPICIVTTSFKEHSYLSTNICNAGKVVPVSLLQSDSPELAAENAVKAAKFLLRVIPGIYNMDDL